MNQVHLFTLLVLLFNVTVHCNILCDHTIYGSTSSKIIVDGTNCVLSGATANAPIHVLNGGNLTFENGVNVNADVKLENAGFFKVLNPSTSGRISSVTDVGGTGELSICGATLSSGLKSTGRVGPISIGVGTCADTISYGPISVTGGEGPFTCANIKSNLPTVTAAHRAGRIEVASLLATSRISITSCEVAYIRNMIVYDKITIMDIGEDTTSGYALISGVTVSGPVKVQNVKGFVSFPSVKSISTTEILDNFGGIFFYNSQFNNLICSGNDLGSFSKIHVFNTTVTSGQGQCANIGN